MSIMIDIPKRNGVITISKIRILYIQKTPYVVSNYFSVIALVLGMIG